MVLCISSWERILKVDQAEGRENGNENSNLSWGIWDMLSKHCFLHFILRFHSYSHISVKDKSVN